MTKPRRPLGVLLGGVLIVAIASLGVLAVLVNRPTSDASLSPQQARGASLFRTRCSSCHATSTAAGIGPGLAGLFEPGGPVLPAGVDYNGNLPNGEPITQESVAAFIRQGGRGQIGTMPAISLSDDEVAAVIAYVQTLKK